ncbi:GGDEF domain-containing protein [Paraherbaspirillum soli]|uniref:GGDEF domain-containing protein n=1 Tax=Paraherbaspirillum soli TaxID=631222 RepID=A0ABW0MCS3_9BURK
MKFSRRATDKLPNDVAKNEVSPATRMATASQRKFALWMCVTLCVITVFLLPFAQAQWGKVPAFLPSYQTAVIGTYLVTAYLMYGHYKATRSEALLHLSAGCLYTAGILIVQFMSFPGAFVEHGSLLGGGQTTIWLWFFWHAGPAVGILLFAWSEFRRPGYLAVNHQQAIRQTGIVLAIAFAATVVLVTVFHAWLPVLDVKGNFSRITSTGIAPALQVLLTLSLVILWRASRFRNVLHVWLGITLVALLCDNAITMMGASRLSLGWYIGRINALISSSVMMLVYLQDIKQSYVTSMAIADRLASSNAQLEMQVDKARLDTLTKLPGRDLFGERAELLRASSVAGGLGFATLFIDLDGFKSINDRFGHEHGDIVLIRAADALRSVLRDTDVVGRLGGDEFVACLSTPAGAVLEIANKISERIVDKIGKIGDGLGASVGVSICNTDMTRALQEADEAMYDAKKLGKNRFNLFHDKPKLVNLASG